MNPTTDYFNGFSINIFQDEEGDWVAYLVEMPSVSAFADSPQTALNQLILAWEGVKESYRQHGEEIPHLAMTKNYANCCVFKLSLENFSTNAQTFFPNPLPQILLLRFRFLSVFFWGISGGIWGYCRNLGGHSCHCLTLGEFLL